MKKLDGFLANQRKTRKATPKRLSIKHRTWTNKTQKELFPHYLE